MPHLPFKFGMLFLAASLINLPAQAQAPSAAPAPPSAAHSPAPVKATPLKMRELGQTQLSNTKEQGLQIADSIESFKTLWKAYAPQGEKAPEIDFRNEVVLALFLGEQATAGYKVWVEQVTRQGNTVVVHAKQTRPDPEAFVAQMLTSPAYLISIPRQPGTQIQLVGLETTISQATPTTTSPTTQEILSMRTLSQTTNSRVTKARSVVARDLPSFKQLWKEHTGSTEGLPQIDFEQEMVVGTFLGEQATGGYHIAIKQVSLEDGEIIVSVQETHPPKDSMTIQMISAPAHIITVSKQNGQVRFRKADH